MTSSPSYDKNTLTDTEKTNNRTTITKNTHANKSRTPLYHTSGVLNSTSSLVMNKHNLDFAKIFPIEIILIVFKYLDYKSLYKASQTRKYWYLITNQNTVWKNLCGQHINKKCYKCGWGLPPLYDRYIKQQAISVNKRENTTKANSTTMPFVCWKSIYLERLVVESNWRNKIFKYRRIKAHTSHSYEPLNVINCIRIYKNYLVSCGSDWKINVFDIGFSTYKLICTLVGHLGSVNCLFIDGCKIVSGSDDSTIKIWCLKECLSTQTTGCKKSISTNLGKIKSLDCVANLLATGGTSGKIKVYDCFSGVYFTLKVPSFANNEQILTTEFDESVVQIMLKNDMLFASYTDGIIRVFSVTHRKYLYHLVDPLSANFLTFEILLAGVFCNSLTKCKNSAHTNNSYTILTSTDDNRFQKWKFPTKKCIKDIKVKQRLSCIDSNQFRVVTGGENGVVEFWDTRSMLLSHSFPVVEGTVKSIQLTDTKILAASSIGHIHVWDCGYA